MAKIKILKDWDEYYFNVKVPNLKFVFVLDRYASHQHIIKNDNNPKNFTVEMFDGIIGKS